MLQIRGFKYFAENRLFILLLNWTPSSMTKVFLNSLRYASCHALQALLLSVVGTHNKDYEENPCRILPKFASRTSHNPDVIRNWWGSPKSTKIMFLRTW